MFIGNYQHNIDPKGRLSIPSKLRSLIQDSVVLSRGLDGCLELRTNQEFENYANKFLSQSNNKQQNRNYKRLLFANSLTVEIDSANRILIPANFKKMANLNKEVVIIGMGDHIELWDINAYEQFNEANFDKFNELAESMDDDH
ncbi:division/cell wall cluster transcriptional repressor MraZ [Mycoplasmoides gallisepticum]|uniref:Transcriptional regulator MraZ n=1 Tax=Mycoplasmoides gallisepticum WI01_2001.043-13-2P TaxID=1159201 RepID=J3YT39_MYCGL|nr:division/cell wall cluster transcriptional repressor MraZ [Mycoplasmoides gallisepticum]AFP75984.1 cell division protein MraZ [Mycoplasmoides gallisepticum VA94_7994-1-7P]AFP76751.1 cell division protein MraZ [Mycoplasmoides gallisepticum NC95_13295-2-2P]AFP77505.1 cell division protein MraZ [Mycoplasmoides gallisepticum NC96_1596-4-2P]AFP78276.1 cell division protein MraZ [Mycoplasmoides gallisepticum NY01_2001.047-5-1P]AFP79036.1 cell division protein MraZ [Mycoplasmoides gallisepticum WI